MAAVYRYEFEVMGRYPFPTDMLRYDCAFPPSPRDVDLMQQGIVGPGVQHSYRDRPMLTFRLVSFVKEPTVDRWRSFGWGATMVEKKRWDR